MLNPGNGAGHVVVQHQSNGDVDIFALSTQNGVVRYRLSGAEIGTGVSNIRRNALSFSLSNGNIVLNDIHAATVEMYNMSGQKVVSLKNSTLIPVGQSRGIFVLKVTDDSGVQYLTKVSL
jgi:hypothetical protein